MILTTLMLTVKLLSGPVFVDEVDGQLARVVSGTAVYIVPSASLRGATEGQTVRLAARKAVR